MNQKALDIMNERFGCDSLISLATLNHGAPSVRIVNSYYKKGSFYTITHALSNKVKHIAICPTVAVCGEWFTANGIGENCGHIRDLKNEDMADTLRTVFAEWYSNGHTDESDPNTIILRIRLTDAVLLSQGTRYDIDFNSLYSE